MPQPEPTEFEKFHGALKKIVSTPKAEIERREAAWQKSRKEIRARRGKAGK